ncbi:hypothetical protein AVEN_242060-1 [Araneus ventricosus]|uniref:Uncharacterized protein n=1 Tax=Araneus ventricosus TaxID=182803 RepID=A0A4Y2R7S2_ARAVE|nr:hypothetical protein AVEN_242060-1 [Araneus ventricosus]
MTRTTPELTSSPNFHATPTGGCLATMYRFSLTGPIMTDLQWNRFGNLKPPAPELRPSILGHQWPRRTFLDTATLIH